jgi:hypothetical protein
MRTFVAKPLAVVASITLAACAAMMPGESTVNVRLSGAEEVPPINVPGSGSGTLSVASDGAVSGSVSTIGVQGAAAHIHQGARGQNGPVIIPLAKSGDTYTVPAGAKLTDAQMQAFKAGNLYVNVHSARYKGGEVRGQLQPAAERGSGSRY